MSGEPSKRIPFVDVGAENAGHREEIQSAVAEVLANSQFILGPAVETFEADFADYCGVQHAVAVSSGTSALHLALIACDVRPGDEVITTPHSWISTSWAIRYVGARPVFVDVEPHTSNISPEAVEAAISPRTKALLPVHLYGRAADVVRLREIADRHGLAMIEDAAQAHGAQVEARRVGSFGEAGCFSFYPAKNLGACGEGGAVVTNDSALADRLRRLRDHAQDGRHHHVELGFNARMDGFQGAVLQIKLRRLDERNSRRRAIAEIYANALDQQSSLSLPGMDAADGHVWHLYSALLKNVDREEFRRRMDAVGIATGVHYPTPIPFQPAFADLGYQRGQFPVAEDIMARCVSLPMYADLSDGEAEYVCESVRRITAD